MARSYNVKPEQNYLDRDLDIYLDHYLFCDPENASVDTFLFLCNKERHDRRNQISAMLTDLQCIIVDIT